MAQVICVRHHCSFPLTLNMPSRPMLPHKKQKMSNTSASVDDGNTLASLMVLNADCIACVLASPAMCCPDGARGLALMARSCRLIGLKGYLDGQVGKVSATPSMAVKVAQDMCKALGVLKLPMSMQGTDNWSWSRMLCWASDAVQVGPLHELKTIKDGLAAVVTKHASISGAKLVEGSVLMLVEPGVYDEAVLINEPGINVTLRACERESDSRKGIMQKMEWVCKDAIVVNINNELSVSLIGMHITGAKSEGRKGEDTPCVQATQGSALCMERCYATCEDGPVVMVSGTGTTASLSGCCIHDGASAGFFIFNQAKATLENNDIHSNVLSNVAVYHEGSEALLRNNRVRNGKHDGVRVYEKGLVTMERNIITGNDLEGVDIQDRSTLAFFGNTIKNNGHCTIQRTLSVLSGWSVGGVSAYNSIDGFPGVRIGKHSRIIMPTGSNTIWGNGKVGNAKQVLADKTLRAVEA